MEVDLCGVFVKQQFYTGNLHEAVLLYTNTAGYKARVVERSYLPVLQKYNRRSDKWDTVLSFDKSLPLAVALNPVLDQNLIPLVDLEPATPAATPATAPAARPAAEPAADPTPPVELPA